MEEKSLLCLEVPGACEVSFYGQSKIDFSPVKFHKLSLNTLTFFSQKAESMNLQKSVHLDIDNYLSDIDHQVTRE